MAQQALFVVRPSDESKSTRKQSWGSCLPLTRPAQGLIYAGSRQIDYKYSTHEISRKTNTTNVKAILLATDSHGDVEGVQQCLKYGTFY